MTTTMAKKKPNVIVPAVDLDFEETMKRLLRLKPPPRKAKGGTKKRSQQKG